MFEALLFLDISKTQYDKKNKKRVKTRTEMKKKNETCLQNFNYWTNHDLLLKS